MVLQTIDARQKSIDYAIKVMDAAAPDADFSVLGIFSNHLAIRAAGHVELSVQEVLSEYARVRGNTQLSLYVRRSVERNNSLNCEKIKAITDSFDKDWWLAIEGHTSKVSRDAVDSLKTIRDQLAHGNHNGTGLAVIKQYYADAKVFVAAFEMAVL